MSSAAGARQRVAVVTGGGGGIGAAIAEELGRRGTFVVTVDPLVTADGSEPIPGTEETTAERIVAAGGSARASSVSVTDVDGVRDLFEGLVVELGGVDAVINVAGITRPTGFATGREEDWLAVLAVHLEGYRNILGAALPIMAAAGHGRVLGVTSGSGWRPADTGAYGAAKRAVAALTWQLGRVAPPGVVVNAMSPIAATRIVTAALSRAQGQAGGAGSSATGGLSLGSMPTPDQLGPLGAHLLDDAFDWCTGQVIFAGGAEVALIEAPRLLEVVRTDGVTSPAELLEAATLGAFTPAEAAQASTGGSNPRFGAAFTDAGVDLPASGARSCAVITDRDEVARSVAAALGARGVACRALRAGEVADGFQGAAAALASMVERDGPIDGLVVALDGGLAANGSASEWERVLVEHAEIATDLHADAAWARAVADHAKAAERAVRLVTLTDATTAGGRSRAQASAQLARAARRATEDRVSAFAVSVESPAAPVGELAAHLLCSPGAPALSGAELVAEAGWIGLRSHPHPGGSISFGGPELPRWFDRTLRSLVGVTDHHE